MVLGASLSQRPFAERLWEREKALTPAWLVAAPLSAAYAALLAARSSWWRKMARRSPLTAISVGNLTVGGNGKTPFALFVATRLRARGIKTAIVSRGYGGRSSAKASLVSDGEQILMNADEAGDEAVMMARCFDGPIAIARRRIDAVELLARRSMADVVVLDDAFQHLRLARELDLVLVNENRGFGNGWLLPAGPMREPWSALGRADAIVMVAAPGAPLSSLDPRAQRWSEGKPILRATLRPVTVVRRAAGSGWNEERPELAGRRVCAVSGLASATGFHAMIRAMGAMLVSTLEYRDHHAYTAADWRDIVAAARGAEMLVTTEKDLVKLERCSTEQTPLYALRVEIAMTPEDEERLLELAMSRLAPAVARASRVIRET